MPSARPKRWLAGASARAAEAARQERGFTIIESLVAAVILVVGLLGLVTLLDTANATTAANQARQGATNIARQIVEDAHSIPYAQVAPYDSGTRSGLIVVLEQMVPGAQSLPGSGSPLTVTRERTSYQVTASVCSMDDPTDGLGDHSAVGSPGVTWCADAGSGGSGDSNPDDYKRVAITVTPVGRHSGERVQQLAIVSSLGVNGPAVTCVSTSATCPGPAQTITAGASPQNPTTAPSSVTFGVKSGSGASSIQWLVNGSPPDAFALAGSADPYIPTGNPSSFTWNFAKLPDGQYLISAQAFDRRGLPGVASSESISLNRQEATPPATFNAGANGLVGTDIQWVPSTDQDLKEYRVYRQIGTDAPVLVGTRQLNQPTALVDTTAPPPPAPPATCQSSSQSYTTPVVYWVVGVDTDPITGQPRESSLTSTHVDADVCNHPPQTIPDNSLTGTTNADGTVSLHWSMPPAPADPDPGDSIQSWRIYRWPANPARPVLDPDDRYAFIGAVDGPGSPVTKYIDQSPDPGGSQETYCVTAVDRHMRESPCSTMWTG